MFTAKPYNLTADGRLPPRSQHDLCLVLDDIKVESALWVALGADGARRVLAGVVSGGGGDLQPVPRRALHGEPVPGRRLVDRFAVFEPLQLKRRLRTESGCEACAIHNMDY